MNKYKLTNKDKLKYFAQYLGCDILIYDGGDPVSHYLEGIDIVSEKVIAERTSYDVSKIKLLLKTNDDIKSLTNNWGGNTVITNFLITDGYSIPYIKFGDKGHDTYSVDELIKEGWIEIKK